VGWTRARESGATVTTSTLDSVRSAAARESENGVRGVTLAVWLRALLEQSPGAHSELDDWVGDELDVFLRAAGMSSIQWGAVDAECGF